MFSYVLKVFPIWGRMVIRPPDSLVSHLSCLQEQQNTPPQIGIQTQLHTTLVSTKESLLPCTSKNTTPCRNTRLSSDLHRFILLQNIRTAVLDQFQTHPAWYPISDSEQDECQGNYKGRWSLLCQACLEVVSSNGFIFIVQSLKKSQRALSTHNILWQLAQYHSYAL